MATVEQQRTLSVLKHEPWRNIVVHLYSVLTWEERHYPAVIFVNVSLVFFSLWAINPSMVTLLSLGALTAVILDFVCPPLSRILFGPKNWSNKQEEQFGKACERLDALKSTLANWYGYFFNFKERKSTIFVIIMTLILFALAWLGSVVNNWLLMYFFTLALLMYPGMCEKNVFQVIKENIWSLFNSKIQQLRNKWTS